MPLPTWYRVMRTLPGAIAGLFFIGSGLYLALAPVSYRDPNNPKMVAYTNSLHPVVIFTGVASALGGLVMLYFGSRLYFRLPEFLREYSYEQLRLGQSLAKEIIRLTAEDQEFHHHSVNYDDGSKAWVSANHYSRGWRPWRSALFYGLGETVTYHRSEVPTEVDGVLHVPEVIYWIDTSTGKASRHESVEQYEIVEEPPLIGEDSPVSYAIRQAIDEGEVTEEEAGWLVEPRFETVHVDYEAEDPIAHYEFMERMGLNKPSAEELRLTLDELRAW